MALKDKKAQVLSSNSCHIYLTPGHHAAKCTSKVSCKHCGKSHHSWLCSKSQDQSEKPKPKNNVKKHDKTDDKSSSHKADALDDEIDAIDDACNIDNTYASEIETTVSNLGRFYELSSAEVYYMSWEEKQSSLLVWVQ